MSLTRIGNHHSHSNNTYDLFDIQEGINSLVLDSSLTDHSIRLITMFSSPILSKHFISHLTPWVNISSPDFYQQFSYAVLSMPVYAAVKAPCINDSSPLYLQVALEIAAIALSVLFVPYCSQALRVPIWAAINMETARGMAIQILCSKICSYCLNFLFAVLADMNTSRSLPKTPAEAFGLGNNKVLNLYDFFKAHPKAWEDLPLAIQIILNHKIVQIKNQRQFLLEQYQAIESNLPLFSSFIVSKRQIDLIKSQLETFPYDFSKLNDQKEVEILDEIPQGHLFFLATNINTFGLPTEHRTILDILLWKKDLFPDEQFTLEQKNKAGNLPPPLLEKLRASGNCTSLSATDLRWIWAFQNFLSDDPNTYPFYDALIPKLTPQSTEEILSLHNDQIALLIKILPNKEWMKYIPLARKVELYNKGIMDFTLEICAGFSDNDRETLKTEFQLLNQLDTATLVSLHRTTNTWDLSVSDRTLLNAFFYLKGIIPQEQAATGHPPQAFFEDLGKTSISELSETQFKWALAFKNALSNDLQSKIDQRLRGDELLEVILDEENQKNKEEIQ